MITGTDQLFLYRKYVQGSCRHFTGANKIRMNHCNKLLPNSTVHRETP